MITRFENVKQVIDLLNDNNVNYLILRNFENLLDDQIYVGGHEDIDFLCENSMTVIEVLGALSNRKKEDLTHYHIFVGGNRVNLDLRSVGDGYYCEEWQKDMLTHKQEYNGFYIMSDEHYYYSLIYHAIIQKVRFTEEYQVRLTKMADDLGISIDDNQQQNFIKSLDQYMKRCGYKYVYTRDLSIPLRFNLVDHTLIQNDIVLRLGRVKFSVIKGLYEIACRIYQLVFSK